MDENRLLKQALYWELDTTKRKSGRPRKNWMNTMRQNLKEIESTWEESQQLSNNKEEWRRSVTDCVRHWIN